MAKNAEKKGAMCNGRLHIMAQVVSVFPLKNWNWREREKNGGKLKNEKQKRDCGKSQNRASSTALRMEVRLSSHIQQIALSATCEVTEATCHHSSYNAMT